MSIRQQLGDFSSIVCFKALITGVEDTLGPEGASVVFIRAGKVRGGHVATSLGLAGKNMPTDQIAEILNNALGQSGTKLCQIKQVTHEGDTIIVDTVETVCSAGEPAGSDRSCTFTLGAIWGALEAIYGKRYEGKQTESVLRGGATDKFVFSPI